MMCSRREPAVDKFPVRSVWILCLCMTLNSYAMVNLFPYVGLMVQELLGLETTNELGTKVGFVASSYTFGRFVGSYASGYATDEVGRKPVIIGGLVSVIVFSLAFGVAPTYNLALLWRFLLGLTNGIAPALRTAMRDVCGQKHAVQGVTYLSGSRAVSNVVGAGIGGLLAQPADNFPNQFDGTGVFGRYPYLLPNLVGACAAVPLLVVFLIYIPESRYFEEQRATTNPTSSADDERAVAEKNSAEDERAVAEKKTVFKATIALSKGTRSRRYQEMDDSNEGEEPSDIPAASLNLESRDLESHEADGIKSKSANTTNEHCGGDGQGITDKEEAGSKEEPSVLAMPNVKMILFIACIQQALLVGFEEVFPLWALSTLDVGGLAWGTVEIGQVLIATGLFVAVLQLFVYPRVIQLVSIETWQRTGCLLSIPAFIIVPYRRDLSWNDSSLFYFSAASMSLVYGFMGMVMVSLTIASTTMIRASMRGKLSGLFNMVGSLGRALGPVGFGISFAWSISPSAYDWVGHTFTFFAAALAVVLVTILSWGRLQKRRR